MWTGLITAQPTQLVAFMLPEFDETTRVLNFFYHVFEPGFAVPIAAHYQPFEPICMSTHFGTSLPAAPTGSQ
jgi:hypothetical protein